AEAAVGLPVAVARLRAHHDPVGVGRAEAVAVPAHPAALARRVADDEGVVRDVPGHDAPRGHEAVAAERDAADDGGVGADGGPAAEPRPLVEPLAVHLAPRVRHVRQHAARPEEHVVLDLAPGVDGDVVLHLHVVPHHDVAADEDVLAEHAAAADPGAGGDVAEVPDLRALPDLAGGV